MENLMPPNNHIKKQTQQGNIFIIILIGVILFGALGYTFSRSASKGTGNLTKQQAKIAAQEILSYAQLLEGAVDRVRRKGCSENEISFENNVVSGYTNPNAPIDKSCHVFDDNGGKVSYVRPQLTWLDSNQSGNSFYNELFITGRSCVSELGGGPPSCSDGGTNYAEIILAVTYLKKDICEHINTSVLNSKNITSDTNNAWGVSKFIGTFSNGYAIDAYINTPSACFQGGTTPPAGTYHFYHSLLTR